MSKWTKIFLFLSITLAIIVVGSLLLINRTDIQTIEQRLPIPIASISPSTNSSIQPKEGVGSETEEFQNAEREFLEKTPLLQKLPYDQQYFTVEYISETELIIHARTSNKARDYQAAKNWFVENGIDTSTINIEYQ